MSGQFEDQVTPSDWKLKLRYGKLDTPFTHFTLLASGTMESESNDFRCPLGPAWMAMKVWATDANEAADMIRVIAEMIGFSLDGKVEIYSTEPTEPPEERPWGYDIRFTPYSE